MRVPPAQPPVIILRIHDLLIWLFPRRIRERYADDMRGFLLRSLSRGQAPPENSRGVVVTVLLSFGKLVTNAIQAHLDVLRKRSRIRNPTPPGRGPQFRSRRNILQGIGRDIRYGVGTLIRSPAYFMVAVLTLGLGIGANTAVFSVVNGVLLKPLLYEEPDRLVRVFSVNDDFETGVLTADAFAAYSDLDDVLSGVAALDFRATGRTLTGYGRPRRVVSVGVSSNYFDVFRARPEFGRTFLPSENSEAASVVVLSHRLWMAITDGDRNILGRRIHLDDGSFEVIGVMPAAFTGIAYDGAADRDRTGEAVDVWSPVDVTDDRGGWLHGIGRLQPDVTIGVINERLRLADEVRDGRFQSTAVFLQDSMVEDVRGNAPCVDECRRPRARHGKCKCCQSLDGT